MRRLLIVLAAGIVVSVPALVGLLGNASFAQRLPLRSPTSASASSDDTPSSSPTSSSTPSPTEQRRRPRWRPPAGCLRRRAR